MWFEVQMIGDSSFMSNHFRGMNGINRIGPPQTIWKLSDHVVKYFLTVKAIFSGGFLEYIHVLGFRMIFWKKSFQFWYVQSYLQIKSVEWKDQGFYRCRVDFFQAPTRNLKVKIIPYWTTHSAPNYPKWGPTHQLRNSQFSSQFHVESVESQMWNFRWDSRTGEMNFSK